MFALAAGKARNGAALGNPVLKTEGRVTLIDGILTAAVPAGLVLNAVAVWWQAPFNPTRLASGPGRGSAGVHAVAAAAGVR
jgi:hypothetical protein